MRPCVRTPWYLQVVLLGLLARSSLAEGADCNGNGRPDDADIAPTSIAFGAFEEFDVVAGGEQKVDLLVSDFDGDGSPDVVASSGTFHFLRNRGDGTFEKPVEIIRAVFPEDPVAMDFDDDGEPDIVYWEGSDASLVILRNSGDGTFAEPETHEVPVRSPVYHLRAADLDGDEAPEIFLAGGFPQPGFLFVLRNDGSAVFTVEEYAIARDPFPPLVGDFDGDGASDVLIGSHEERVCQLLRNSGDGSLAPAEAIKIEPFAASFAAADFDGDGDLDLATESIIFRNDGSASFAGEEFASPIRIGLLVGDVDGDGDPDLCGRRSNLQQPEVGLVVQLNAGDGTFDPPLTFTDGWASHIPVALADFDGDGAIDVFGLDASCGKGGVLFRLPGLSGQSLDLDSNGIPDECQPDCDDNELPDSHQIAEGLSADCNQNDVPDECELASPPFHFQEAWKSPDLPDVRKVLLVDMSNDSRPDIVALTSEPIDPITLVDWNGGMSLISRKSRVFVLFNDGNGAFDRAVELPGLDLPRDVAAADLDADGDMDLVASDFLLKDVAEGDDVASLVAVFLNSGDGSLTRGEDHALRRRCGSWVQAEDVDQDGEVDVLVQQLGSPGTVVVLPGTGEGVFGTSLELFPASVPAGALVDVNADGWLDFMEQDEFYVLNVRLNDGDFRFSERQQIAAANLLTTGDFDGDGKDDLILRAPLCDRRFGLYQDTNGGLTEVDVFPDEPANWGLPVAADLDSDGDLDLAAQAGGLAVLLNDGRGVFSSPAVFNSHPGRPTAGDLNGDGRVDIVLGGFGAAPGLAVLVNQPNPRHRADVDGNGLPDECQIAGRQVVGDGNQDGGLNLSDPIWLLRHLFQGAATRLPCSGRKALNPTGADLAVLDANEDAVLDLADVVSVLRFLFFAISPSPRLGGDCQVIQGCPEVCAVR